MRKISTAVIFVALVLSLTSCADKVTGATKENRFLTTNDIYYIDGSRYDIVVDKATNIAYLVTDYHGGITVLYNAEGKPMTFDEYNETKKLY